MTDDFSNAERLTVEHVKVREFPFFILYMA